jgi:hypothetical protein
MVYGPVTLGANGEAKMRYIPVCGNGAFINALVPPPLLSSSSMNVPSFVSSSSHASNGALAFRAIEAVSFAVPTNQ